MCHDLALCQHFLADVANQPRTNYLESFFNDFYDLLSFLNELNLALFKNNLNTYKLIL